MQRPLTSLVAMSRKVLRNSQFRVSNLHEGGVSSRYVAKGLAELATGHFISPRTAMFLVAMSRKVLRNILTWLDGFFDGVSSRYVAKGLAEREPFVVCIWGADGFLVAMSRKVLRNFEQTLEARLGPI